MTNSNSDRAAEVFDWVRDGISRGCYPISEGSSEAREILRGHVSDQSPMDIIADLRVPEVLDDAVIMLQRWIYSGHGLAHDIDRNIASSSAYSRTNLAISEPRAEVLPAGVYPNDSGEDHRIVYVYIGESGYGLCHDFDAGGFRLAFPDGSVSDRSIMKLGVAIDDVIHFLSEKQREDESAAAA